MTALVRRFVEVGGRRVHYRRQGAGPPLVLLHGSPGNSSMLADEMAAAAPHFTCFALDTPGFGGSDPLPGEVLTVAALAEATAAAMSALDLPPCPVYGTHTGAAIGLEFGVGWPERTTGLVLEGVPIFTDEEIAVFFDGYFEPLHVDALGSHLTSTWVRFRDQFTWFPWRSRDVERRNPVDRPTSADIDHWVSMFYQSCWTYAPAYRAACTYGYEAHRAAAALRVPAVFLASAEDMLHGHLDRLPPLQPNQQIERLPYDPPAKFTAIVEFARAMPNGLTRANGASCLPVGKDPALQFIDTDTGQVLVRCFGDPRLPALFLLHDAPGSGAFAVDLARELATQCHVIVPDLPGNGESAAPASDQCILTASAEALSNVASALGLTRFAVAGLGCGGSTAAMWSTRGDTRLSTVIVKDLPKSDEAVASAIAPPLSLSAEGAHWLRAWLMIRDAEIYRPWFDGRVTAQRSMQGNFDARWLHDRTVALMQARTTYHRLPEAAYRYDGDAALATTAIPVHRIVTGRDSRLDLAAAILTIMSPGEVH